jgi:hypothetical protein
MDRALDPLKIFIKCFTINCEIDICKVESAWMKFPYMYSRSYTDRIEAATLSLLCKTGSIGWKTAWPSVPKCYRNSATPK